MPDIFAWVMLALGIGVGVGAAFAVLKTRGQEALHAKDNELAGLVAKEAVLQLRQQELTQQVSQLQGELSQKQSNVSELQGRMAEAQASFAAREKLLRESNERMKVEFESLATKVLNAQGAQQRQSLDVLLNPFASRLAIFVSASKRCTDRIPRNGLLCSKKCKTCSPPVIASIPRLKI